MTTKRNVISGIQPGTEKRTLMEKLAKPAQGLEFSLKTKKSKPKQGTSDDRSTWKGIQLRLSGGSGKDSRKNVN